MNKQILRDKKISIRPVLFAFCFTIIASVFSNASFAQSKFSMGISGGYDKTFNHLAGMTYSNADKIPDFNFGVDGMLQVGKKFRLKTEVHYSSINFTRSYNFQNPSLERVELSKMAVSNLDVTPKIDYLLLTRGKFDLYASAGVKVEFSLGKFEQSFRANGEQTTSNLISDSFTKIQYGAVGGLVFKYNLSEFTAVTLMPEYTYFFDKFYSKNTSNLQRVGVNLGVEWKF